MSVDVQRRRRPPAVEPVGEVGVEGVQQFAVVRERVEETGQRRPARTGAGGLVFEQYLREPVEARRPLEGAYDIQRARAR
ncbi:hypothetical protein [Streptomyces sp. NBC_01262]|uniref:hypothetical protein n=1 Tax=Streptomyces sp. NBC_01262 TaxID=2903803 RepID=UPI002E2F5B26|nr:hypothetical protein [Streptomyces sp. NBC_01262]